MKLFCRLLVIGSVLGLTVGMVIAQEVYHPGNGVSLPVVVKEVHPDAQTAADVLLDCVVREDGAVSDVEVKSSPDAKLNQAAIQALRQWTFKPGMKDGKPVPVSISVEISFRAK